jgi:hypothetical protein
MVAGLLKDKKVEDWGVGGEIWPLLLEYWFEEVFIREICKISEGIH